MLIRFFMVNALGLFPLNMVHADELFVPFGKLDGEVQSIHGTNPSPGGASSFNRVVTNSSRIAVKGNKALESDMQALYQIATRVNLTGNETGGGGGTFTLMGNTGLGLKGAFGTVIIGMWDTPFRYVHSRIDRFDGSHIGHEMAILGSVGNGVDSATATALPNLHASLNGVTVASTNFYRRQKSSIQYWTANLDGFEGRIAYSVDNQAQKTASADPYLWSSALLYSRGAVYAALAYELHHDMKVDAATSTLLAGSDDGVRLVAAYNFQHLEIGVAAERLEYETTAIGKTGRSAYTASLLIRPDENRSISAVFTRSGDLRGSSESHATQLSLRYGHYLTTGKQTELYAEFTRLANGDNASYNFGDGLMVSSGRGSALRGIGIGMAHGF